MKSKTIRILIPFLLIFLILGACTKNENSPNKDQSNDGSLKVVVTFSILYDIVQQVGGDLVDVHSMVPIGTDPHEYDPLPEDITKGTDADVLFYNGLNLEGGENGWFFRFVDSVGQNKDVVFKLMEGIEPMYISSEDGMEKEVNPHAFLDPVVGMKMVENARDALIKVDPDNEKTYTENASKYLNELKAIDQEYADKISQIPEENRVLVTSERAFQYMANRYGLKEGYIWEIDTEELGTVEQITSLINFIKERNVPVLFVETNVDKRPMESVANETGVEIFAELFSDEIGKPGEIGDTYIKFLKHNIDTIFAGLSKE